MRSQQIKEILEKHGVENLENLSNALEEILTKHTKDSSTIDTISRELGRKQQRANRNRGIL